MATLMNSVLFTSVAGVIARSRVRVCGCVKACTYAVAIIANEPFFLC